MIMYSKEGDRDLCSVLLEVNGSFTTGTAIRDCTQAMGENVEVP